MSRDDERPKKSWRELDARKDRSAHRRDERPAMNHHRQGRADMASRSYRSRLDGVFDGDGAMPTHMKEKFAVLDNSPEGQARKAAAQRIMDAKTSIAKDAAVEDYLDKHKLPPDYALLAEILGCSDDEYVEMALDEIAAMMDAKRIPKRTALLEQRLKRVQSLGDDAAVVEKATDLIRRLRIF